MSDLIQMPHAAVLPVIRSAVTPGTGWELFNPLSLDPLVYFDAQGGSMLDSGGAAASHGDTVAVLDDLAESSVALVLPGTSGNYASLTKYIPTSGVFRVEVGLLAYDYTPASNMQLVSVYKTGGNQRSWQLNLQSSGVLRVVRSTDGTTTATADSSVVVPDQTRFVAFSWDIDSGTVDFETSADGLTWSALGTQQALATAPYDATASLEIGSYDDGNGNIYSGSIQSVILKQDGTAVRSIDFTAQTAGATSFTASTGQTVTINQSGDYPARIGGTSYAAQSTDSLRPVALTETGVYLPGVSGNYVSSTKYIPTSGVFRAEVGLLLDDYRRASNQSLCGVWNSSGDERGWLLRTEATTGELILVRSTDGAVAGTDEATSSLAIPDGTRYVAAEWDIDGGTVDFETSADGVTWSALGTQQSLSTAPNDSTAGLEVGSNGAGSSAPCAGVITSVILKQDGTIVRNLPFATSADAHGSTTVTAAVGPDGTINQSGDDPATLIRFAVPRGDGSDDYMTATGITTATAMTAIIVFDMVGAGESAGRLLSGFADAAAETGAGGFYLARVTTTDNLAAYSHTGTVIGTATNGATGKHIATITVEDGAQAFRLDGASIGTGSEAGDTEIENLAVWSASNGGTNTAADIPMVFLVGRVLTTAEIEKAEAYWASANRYDITLA